MKSAANNGEIVHGEECQHFKDPKKEGEIEELLKKNDDIMAKANLNRKKKRAILNALRVTPELNRQVLRDIVTKVTTAEPTAEEKKKHKAKKVRMEERMKEKKEKLKAMTKEERKAFRLVKKESAIGNMIRGGYQILSKQLEEREGIQQGELEEKPKKRRRLGTVVSGTGEESSEQKKSRRKEERDSYLDVPPKEVKLKVTEEGESTLGQGKSGGAGEPDHDTGAF